MDYSLCLVTDSGLSRGRSLRSIVEAAIRGGATLVQYRDKSASTRRMIEEARELLVVCRAAGVPLIVNDRVDVALAVGADGVHVGQDDMPAREARALIGEGRLLGVSAENLEQARRAAAEGADYVGASPVFPTPTKDDAPPPMGPEGLLQMAAALTIPVVAIGGINERNAEEIIRCGAAGIAVVSAIASAQDPEGAARKLCAIVSRARGRS
jgi:thiamine-phosphate pyrophosphorylase